MAINTGTMPVVSTFNKRRVRDKATLPTQHGRPENTIGRSAAARILPTTIETIIAYARFELLKRVVAIISALHLIVGLYVAFVLLGDATSYGNTDRSRSIVDNSADGRVTSADGIRRIGRVVRGVVREAVLTDAITSGTVKGAP